MRESVREANAEEHESQNRCSCLFLWEDKLKGKTGLDGT